MDRQDINLGPGDRPHGQGAGGNSDRTAPNPLCRGPSCTPINLEESQNQILHRLGAWLKETISNHAKNVPINNEPVFVQAIDRGTQELSLYKGSFWPYPKFSEEEFIELSNVGSQESQNLDHTLQVFTSAWPRSMKHADTLQDYYFAPKITHLEWSRHSRAPIEPVDITENADCPLLYSVGEIKTRNQLKTSPDGSTGSICFMQVKNYADVLSTRDISHIGTHLLEGLLSDSDYYDLGGNPSRWVTDFVFPLCRKLDFRHDNRAWGWPVAWSHDPVEQAACPCHSFAGIMHHMQCLSLAPRPDIKELQGVPPNRKIEGLSLNRQYGALVKDKSIFIGERRISIAVTALCNRSMGPDSKDLKPTLKRYNAMCVVSPGSEDSDDLGRLLSTIRTSRYPQLSGFDKTHVPVAVFLMIYSSIIPLWSSFWISFLDGIDAFFNVEPQNLLIRGSTTDPAVDSVLDESLLQTETHFQILQLLRIAALWVGTAAREFHRVRAEIMEPDTNDPLLHFLRNLWDDVEAKLDEHSKNIISRIDRKTEEIKSLRDGLFHATSLGEATRGTQINEYIFVFTVMTIVFLPLNFIASLYSNSISLFDARDNTYLGRFSVILLGVSMCTYIVSFFMIWVVRRGGLKRFHWMWRPSVAKLDLRDLRKPKRRGTGNLEAFGVPL
ncbi:unnamed protein product [Clonostachys rosea]|uniref:Uncharacterized protein n=1 Tax=Bionectria ochroleuca TaxID=29856 RepID=A0ABY6TVT9_BIOOC|nr:unnamed protein product [Clonostachys rosea]